MPKNLDDVRRLARKDSFAVVTTVRPDGTIHASLVTAGVLDDPISDIPSVGFVAHGSSRKLGHLRTSGRAAVVFRFGPDWIAVEGVARLVGPDDPVAGFGAAQMAKMLRDVFVAAGGTHQDWDEFDKVMRAERRTAVFVSPERISANG
jgi:PPOX class probable F420-dependent enzyme